MKLNQLAAAVILATGSVSAVAATYSVTQLPVHDFSKNSFARSLDNSGTALTSVQYEFSPPIDVERLDDSTFYTSSSYPLENEEDVKQGIFSDADYTTIVSFLLANRGGNFVQQLASYRGYSSDGTDYQLIPGFDEVTELFDDYTNSVVTVPRDSLNGDFIVGTSEGIYKEIDYTNEDDEDYTFTYNEMGQQAFVEVNGVTHRLAPEADLLNGMSQAYAINDNLQVAGFGTTEFLEAFEDLVDDCSDPEERGDQPEEICLKTLRVSSTFTGSSQIRPHIWQLDATGEVIDVQIYPMVFTPDEDSTLSYYARAYGINNQGIAVGESLTGEVIIITRPESNAAREYERVATVFQDGETVEFLPREENLQSSATDINDENWITGYVTRAPNEIAREYLFVYNLETGEARYPEGFFIGAGADANAINNNNIVVGKSDVESSTERYRETHAFMYNIDTEEFTDLNDLLECDSPYTLVEAVDINDNNEIIANARIRENATYITGTDIINSAGENVLTDNIVAVKLSPISGGSVDQCDVVEEEEPYERKGAAISPWWLMLLSGLILTRRRKRMSA